MTTLTLVGLLLPTDNKDRTLIGLVNLLITTLYLMYFSQVLPTAGRQMPLIGKVALFSLFLFFKTSNLILSTLNYCPDRDLQCRSTARR